MTIDNILIELRAALADGLPRELAYYGGGSRQGQARQLLVKEISESANEMKVQEPHWPELKTYRLHKILWITSRSGHRVENKEAIQRRAEFQSEIQDRDKKLSILKSGAKLAFPGAGAIALIAKLPATVADKAITMYAVGHKVPTLSSKVSNQFWPRTAMITAKDSDSAERACDAINFLNSDGYLSIWRLLEIFLACKVTWPVWERFHRSLIAEGEALRASVVQ